MEHGFSKAHSTQHALFKLLQSLQKELDNGGFVGTIVMDLSKAYDCIPYELLIAKLKILWHRKRKSGITIRLSYYSETKDKNWFIF